MTTELARDIATGAVALVHFKSALVLLSKDKGPRVYVHGRWKPIFPVDGPAPLLEWPNDHYWSA